MGARRAPRGAPFDGSYVALFAFAEDFVRTRGLFDDRRVAGSPLGGAMFPSIEERFERRGVVARAGA